MSGPHHVEGRGLEHLQGRQAELDAGLVPLLLAHLLHHVVPLNLPA